MTMLASITMPEFSSDEVALLRRTEGVLSRHSYMRADLAAVSPIAKGLEDALSVRLGLLHSKGAPDDGDCVEALLGKLASWERELAARAVDEGGSDEVLLRYETTLLLHPTPGTSGAEPLPDVDRLTQGWERLRDQRSTRAVFQEKAQQNRDFFRHGAMLPFYWTRRARIRKHLPRIVFEHPALAETLFAIEQVGPLVDNFAFKGAAGVPWSTSVALADVAFLYMQLADEFLDELAAAAGGYDAVGRLLRRVYRADTSERPLIDLSLAHLHELGVEADRHYTKFGMSLAVLFDALTKVAASMDSLLEDADPSSVHATHVFLHHCFQTYLDEAALCDRAPQRRADRMRLQDTAWHFYRKNNMVMMLWLNLRARLLGLDPAKHVGAIRRWGYVLASFQIFDDLKDIALDVGRQPSYPLQIAANDFPEEFVWIEHRFGSQRRPVTRDEVPEVNEAASGTVQRCMRYSRLIALAHFDYTLRYAWDQRWRKSWMARRKSLNPGGAKPTASTHAVDRLVRSLLATERSEQGSAANDDQLAFALDTAAYEGSWQIYLALFPDVRAIYRFATLRIWMSPKEKAGAARRLLRRYPRARANALLGLTDGDVDHQVAGDGLEAFAKLIEV